MKIIRLDVLLYSMLLLNIAVLNGVSQGGSGFWGAPFMGAARRWLSTTQLLPHSTSQQDTGMVEILRDIGETARARIQEQELIEQRDEALRQAEPVLRRDEPSLVNAIAERFFLRTIYLDDLAEPTGQLDYVVSGLTILVRRNEEGETQQITSEQIQRIGQRFPNLRELSMQRAGLGDEGLRILSGQPFARNLTMLNISANNITAAGLAALSKFTSLTSLNVSYNNKIGDTGLLILSEQPFAPRLIELNISGTEITSNVLPALNKFTSIKTLRIGNNELRDAGLAVLAEQPIASQLAVLAIDRNGITVTGIENSFGLFSGLTHLLILSNSIGDQGLAALAKLPIADQLDELFISDTGITLQGISTSLRAFTRLTSLGIASNNLGNEALRILSEQPFAHNLTNLTIRYGNGLTAETIKKYKNKFTNLKSIR